ncbi:hypothetical protein BZA77DRAFT_45349 [Pyronema omphalodes]|nr:hypothetical protein BZA77DRAFT_45349 [Pyronema omphalodes]
MIIFLHITLLYIPHQPSTASPPHPRRAFTFSFHWMTAACICRHSRSSQDLTSDCLLETVQPFFTCRDSHISRRRIHHPQQPELPRETRL